MSDKEQISLEDLKQEASETAKEKKMSERCQLIVFKLDGEEYALPIDQVKEVVITPRVAKVPQTPNYVIGAANIRGNVIAIIDLEQKFELKDNLEFDQINTYYTLVIENDLYRVGLLVKEVPNTLTIDIDEIDQSKDVIQFSSLDERCVQGIVKTNNRMIILVNIIALLETDESNSILKKL